MSEQKPPAGRKSKPRAESKTPPPTGSSAAGGPPPGSPQAPLPAPDASQAPGPAQQAAAHQVPGQQISGQQVPGQQAGTSPTINQGQPQAGYPQQHAGYPPQQHAGYPQQAGSPQQGGYPQQAGSPQQGGYPPQPGGYPPQQGGYPPQQGGYPPQQGGQPYPPGYPPQPGYPPRPSGPQAPRNYIPRPAGPVAPPRPPLAPRQRRGAMIAGAVGFTLMTLGFTLIAIPLVLALLGAFLGTIIGWVARNDPDDFSPNGGPRPQEIERFIGEAWSTLLPWLIGALILGIIIWLLGYFSSLWILRSHKVNRPVAVTWSGLGIAVVGNFFLSALSSPITGLFNVWDTDFNDPDDFRNFGDPGQMQWMDSVNLAPAALGLALLFLLISLVVNAAIGLLSWWWMAHVFREQAPADRRVSAAGDHGAGANTPAGTPHAGAPQAGTTHAGPTPVAQAPGQSNPGTPTPAEPARGRTDPSDGDPKNRQGS